jgi:hypothetical protein
MGVLHIDFQIAGKQNMLNAALDVVPDLFCFSRCWGAPKCALISLLLLICHFCVLFLSYLFHTMSALCCFA